MPTTVTPKTIQKGDDLMVFIETTSGNDTVTKSIAYATAHTLTLTAETASVNSKDHGIWTGNEVNKRSWEITSENLYTDEDYSTLFDAWAGGTKLSLVWAKKAEADSVVVADGDAANYTAKQTGNGTTYWSGKAYITSLTANANSGEKATFSVTFTGTGAFTKTTVTS